METFMDPIKTMSFLQRNLIKKTILSDHDFMHKACTIEPWSLQYASDAIKSDREIVLLCVKQSSQCLELK